MRRFPPPWTLHENASAYWVEDADGSRFGFCYFKADRAADNPAYLTKEEARRIAANIARLPELLKKDG